MTSTRTWSNWAGNQSASARRVVTPRSAAQTAEAVTAAARDGLTVKAVGSGHSFTAAAATDGVLVRPEGMTRVRSIDRETGLVTVEAGMPLHKLNELLAEQGLAMTNLGDIEVQTVAGAISTGTHGTGRESGSIAAQVRAVEVVLADGTVAHCSPTEDGDLFEAARLGVGAIGVLTAVTFQTEPAFLLKAREEPMRLEAVLDDFEDLAKANEHFEFYWFPHTDGTIVKRNNRSAGPAAPLSGRRFWWEDEFLSNTVFGAACRAGNAAPRAIKAINKISARALSSRTYIDLSHKVYCSPRRVRFVEMEYAVPRAALPDAVREIRALIDRAGLLVSFPLEIRVAPADDLWLSTASGRDTAYIACHMFHRSPYQDYFDGVEEILVGFAGRPHWGKLHTRKAAYLAESYPRFSDFLGVRDRVDPDRVFANPYLEQVFGA